MGQTAFISYARADGAVASQLADGLSRSGIDVWIDRRLEGGQDWWDEILDRIESADYFVFALSSNSLDSVACQREYEYAVELERRILPVQVGEVRSEMLLEERLGRIQRVSFDSSDVGTTLDVIRSLTSLPPAPPIPSGVQRPGLPMSYIGRLRAKILSSNELNPDAQRSLASQLVEEFEKAHDQSEIVLLADHMINRSDILFSVANRLNEEVIHRVGPATGAGNDPGPGTKMDDDVPNRLDAGHQSETAVTAHEPTSPPVDADREARDVPSITIGQDSDVPGDTRLDPTGYVGPDISNPEPGTGDADSSQNPPVDDIERDDDEATTSPVDANSGEPESTRTLTRVEAYLAATAAAVWGIGTILNPLDGDLGPISITESHHTVVLFGSALCIAAPVAAFHRRWVSPAQARAACTGGCLAVGVLVLVPNLKGLISIWQSDSRVLNLLSAWMLIAAAPLVVAAFVVSYSRSRVASLLDANDRRYPIAFYACLAVAAIGGLVIADGDRLAFPWAPAVVFAPGHPPDWSVQIGAVGVPALLFAASLSERIRYVRPNGMAVFAAGIATAFFLSEAAFWSEQFSRGFDRYNENAFVGSDPVLRIFWLGVGALYAVAFWLALRRNRTRLALRAEST